MRNSAPSTVTMVSVTTRLDGSEFRIPVHEAKGDRDGPTLTLVSTQHGAEWFSVEIVRRILGELTPGALRGRVVGIPVANPIALEHFTRMTPDESDEPDLNRVWPGGTTWITEQIAAALDKEVLATTDYLMDFHPGPWGAALATIGYGADLPDEKVRRASLEMALAFGHPSVRALKMMGAFPGPRSIAGYAGSVRKIPNIGPCLGGRLRPGYRARLGRPAGPWRPERPPPLRHAGRRARGPAVPLLPLRVPRAPRRPEQGRLPARGARAGRAHVGTSWIGGVPPALASLFVRSRGFAITGTNRYGLGAGG